MEYKTRPMENPAIPTGDYRHISHVREGKQSAEVWSHQRRAEWHEEYDGPAPQWGTLKEVVNNARQSVSEGSAESVSPDAKNLRRKERKASLLRAGKQKGQGEKHERESQKRLQKTKARKTQVKK